MIANLDDILARADSNLQRIIEATATGISFRRDGARLQACCPFHEEKTPSFKISPNKGLYHCFSCKKGGDSIKFLETYLKLDFPQAVVKAAEILNIPVEYNGLKDVEAWRKQHKAAQDTRTRLFAAAHEAAAVFHAALTKKTADTYEVAGRQYSAEVVKSFQLGIYAPPPGGVADLKAIGATLMKDRHIFPIHDVEGRVVAFGGRLPNWKKGDKAPKYINSPGFDKERGEVGIYDKSATLYGLFQNSRAIEKADHALMVEGYTDVITLFTNGIAAVAPCGTALTPQQGKLLSGWCDGITLFFDGDEAGRKAARRAILNDNGDKKSSATLPYFTDIRVCFLPEGHDPDSFVRANAAQIKPFIEEKSEDAILWYIRDGLSLKNVAGKKEAINRAKAVFQFLDRDRARLYQSELEQELGIPDLWKFLRPEQEVDTAAIIEAAKLAQAANAVDLKFPFDAFPATIRSIIEQWQTEMKLPVEYFAGSMLTVAGAAIGNKYVNIWRGRVAPALLYTVLVGPSGDGKSPVFTRVAQPLWDLDDEKKHQYIAAKTRYKQAVFSAKTSTSGEVGMAEPQRQEIIVEDATVEKIVKMMSCHEVGVVSIQNEFKTFLGALSRYSSGDTLGFWLNIYDTIRLKRQRSSEETIDIHFPFCSLLTGIQPGILKEIAEGDKIDSGYFARLSFFWPQNFIKVVPPKENLIPSEKHIKLWSDIIYTLYNLPSECYLPTDEVPYCKISRVGVNFSDEALDEFWKWLCENTKKYNDEEIDTLKSISSKAENLVMRLALILHFMRLATESDMNALLESKPEHIAAIPIDVSDVRGAIALAEYLRQTSALVLSRFDNPAEALNAEQRGFYQALPNEFKTAVAIEVGKGLNKSESWIKRFLRDRKFFIPNQAISGHYRKRYE